MKNLSWTCAIQKNHLGIRDSEPPHLYRRAQESRPAGFPAHLNLRFGNPPRPAVKCVKCAESWPKLSFSTLPTGTTKHKKICFPTMVFRLNTRSAAILTRKAGQTGSFSVHTSWASCHRYVPVVFCLRLTWVELFQLMRIAAGVDFLLSHQTLLVEAIQISVVLPSISFHCIFFLSRPLLLPASHCSPVSLFWTFVDCNQAVA